MDVLPSAHSRASSHSRRRADPLIFTAPGRFDSKPNDRADASIPQEDLRGSLATATRLFQLLLRLRHFDIKFGPLE